VENKIAAGLIEEVIVVAQNELQLVKDMLKDRPYVHQLSYLEPVSFY
jgi:hypothetical protein